MNKKIETKISEKIIFPYEIFIKCDIIKEIFPTKEKMPMNLRDILYKELSENGILEAELSEYVKKITTTTIKNENKEKTVTKDAVLTYLKAQGMQPSQKNYEYAERCLQNKLNTMEEGAELELSFAEQEYINHLNEFSDDDMKTLIDICLLKKLSELEDRMIGSHTYEYAVCSYENIKAALDAYSLEDKINEYAKKGYRIKNSVSLSGMGINSMGNQLVIIFERLKL